MRILYRTVQAAFLVMTATLVSNPVHAQLSEREREEIREHAREQRLNRLAGPPVAAPITSNTFTLPAPVIVNFSERAAWDLAHPKTDFTKYSVEDEAGENGYKFRPQTIKPDAKVCPIPKAGPSSDGSTSMKSTNSPAPILAFNAIMGDGSEIPPDIKLAAGVNYVMETTNQQYAIFNKTTGALVSNVDINTFYSASGGNGFFDPHVLYDAPHGRWLAVIDGNTSGGHGGLFLAVSQTNNPTGNWYVYTIDDGTASSSLLDFPEMGYNQNWVVLTANLFGNTSTNTEVYIMSRASLYAGTQGTVTHFEDANSFCVSPAQTMDTTTLTEYLVQNANGNSGGNGYVQVGKITGTVAAPSYTAGTQLGIAQPWNENSVQAVQKGGGANLIDNDDTRIYASEYINGSMWFAHTVWLPASGTATSSAVDWWQINPATLTVQQFGRVSDPTTPSWYFYPNIYANASGDALLGYGVSSTSQYASAVYSFHASTDAVNTMENLYDYKAGVASFAPSGFGSDYRWGDYTGVAVDPVDNSFWAAGEWANTGNLWATEIAHVASSAPITVPPVANFQANTTTSTCTGIISFTDLSTNAPTSWLWTFGDGATSTVQNPTHTYVANGTYTVTLKATNTYGNNTKTSTNYITITLPAGPAAVGASHCGSGTFSLSATTTNPVKWYDSTGTLLSTSNPFVTPTITHTTTYYVADSIIAPTYHAGPLTNTAVGAGSYVSTTYGLNFNVLKAGTLQSVYLYAQAAGSITIQLSNSGGSVVSSTTVNVVAGGQRVTLNFPLIVSTGNLLAYTGTPALYRNNAGAVYPYADADGIVSITGNNAGTVPAYYYFFYDWIVKEGDCNSQTTAVTATVTAGVTTGTPTATNVACNGGATGSATVTPTGGTPAYTYNWSNGQTAATLTGVVAGTYTVSVHDAASCSGTATVTITQPTALNVSVTKTNSGCGAPNGTASATVSGGTTAYTYHWSNSATTASLTGLAAATYTLTVTDAHSCTVSSSAVISSSSSLNLTTTPSASNCSGGATGGASVNVNGGTAPFTYHWSNGATTAAIANVSPATYLVTVTDNGGCSGTASAVVTTSAALNLSATSTNIACFNSNNGSASVSVTSGTAPYNYAWNTGATTTAITNLTAGNYFVTVTDAHSCVKVDTIAVTQPSAITIFVSAVQPTCSGLNNGSATVTATGGITNYSFHWSTNVNGTGISNLSPGNYSVTLTDANNCTSTAAFSITNPVPVTASVVSQSASCFGVSDGNVQITPAGGTSPYSYLWSNSSTTATATNLAAGSYTVTITDSHNCSTTSAATVTQPSQIVAATSSTDATGNQSNGTASVSGVSGGVSPYTVAWSNGGSGNTISNLAAGTYTVTVTDHSGCQTTATVTVNTSVGIAQLTNDLPFTIFPNPAKNEVTVDAVAIDKETTMVLEDILGQTLVTRTINPASSTTVDLTNYSNGVYFIELQQSGKRAVKKFIISK